MVKTQPGERNIFNITQPEIYRCQVYRYHNKLSRLYLSVFKGQATVPAFFLLFADVAYFDCPVNWTGADFTIAEGDDCIELLLSAGLIGQAILRFPNAYASITDYARLYLAQTQAERQVRIIANSANMVREIPADVE